MKALLVHPAIPDTLWSLKYVIKASRKKGFFPPLGLLTVAGLMPRDWELRLVDMTTEELPEESIKWADMVFLGAMVVQKRSARQVVDQCHSLGKRVVAGGPLVTASPHEFDDIDHLILNEAEITFPQFLADLVRGEPAHVYSSPERPDLTGTPLPRWDLVNIHDYLSATVQYSRGCPYDCEFCNIVHLFGRQPRVKTADQVIREIEAVHEAGWRGRLFFSDDNFVGAKAQVRAMLPTLIQWQRQQGHPFRFQTQASIDLAADEELMDLMATAGFDVVLIGFESTEEASLKETRKYHNCGRDMIQAVKALHNHGIEVAGSFIVGFDNDPEDIFQRQMDFVQNSGMLMVTTSMLNAFPKTRLYERLESEGRLVGELTGDHTDGSVNFVPKMDLQTLRQGYDTLIRSLYSPQYFYRRMLTFLKDFHPRRRVKFDFMFALTFIAGIVYAGILDKAKGKRFFWKVLLKTLSSHPASLWKIMMNSLLGYHIRRRLQGTD